MTIEKSDKRSLAVITEEKLLEMIRERKMKPGDRLDNEYELARKLQVGRSTIREAVKSMESRNIVTIRQGAGTFISEEEGIPKDPLGISLMGRDEQTVLDLLEVRMILEPESAAMAALNRSRNDLALIEKQCEKVETLIKKGEVYTVEDVKFHQLIARATGNRIITNLIPIIHRSIVLTMEMTDRRLQETTVVFHRQILECMERRDGRGARSSMMAHISENRLFIIKEIERKKKFG